VCTRICIQTHAHAYAKYTSCTYTTRIATIIIYTCVCLYAYTSIHICIHRHTREDTWACASFSSPVSSPAKEGAEHASCLMSHASCLMSHVSCLMSHVSCLMSRVGGQRTPQIKALGARFYEGLGERFCEGSGERFCEALGDFDFRCLWGSSPSARARGVF